MHSFHSKRHLPVTRYYQHIVCHMDSERIQKKTGFLYYGKNIGLKQLLLSLFKLDTYLNIVVCDEYLLT